MKVYILFHILAFLIYIYGNKGFICNTPPLEPHMRKSRLMANFFFGMWANAIIKIRMKFRVINNNKKETHDIFIPEATYTCFEKRSQKF